jgi:UDP-N-acetylglucosamine--N-acetylmuramyl-(pentapeptide) pyrophosphoryl-undecaprenol N-acetylglucosamine transferase
LTIVVTGGGSGGHITPVLAVAAALKKTDANIRVVFIGQAGDHLADIPAADPNIDAVYTVRAGKFRRYHGLGLRQWFDFKTLGLNLRDLAYIGVGMVQSYGLLRRITPDIIFTRGGFVSVPVALAGKLQGVPYITHDSDSTPSLANRIIARWARLHAVALPEEVYPYPRNKTITVGVPISSDYQPTNPSLIQRYRRELKLPAVGPILLITGGGNGARQLNQVVLDSARVLLKRYPNLTIVHIAGRALETTLSTAYDTMVDPQQRARVIVKGFVNNLYAYSGAADLVIARGGATNLAEFAAQAKACIIIPSPQLIWNVKNAETLAKRHAIAQLSEEQAEQEGRLAQLIARLLDDPDQRLALGAALASVARPKAAAHLAEILIEQAGQGSARADT